MHSNAFQYVLKIVTFLNTLANFIATKTMYTLDFFYYDYKIPAQRNTMLIKNCKILHWNCLQKLFLLQFPTGSN